MPFTSADQPVKSGVPTSIYERETDPAFTGDNAGRAIAMTVYSPVRPWYRRAPRRRFYERGTPWLRTLFLLLRGFRSLSSDIAKLSFIHFARWIVIRRFPDFGQPRERLRRKLLMFESNYNGDFSSYIDGFAYVLGDGMAGIWGTSYGFPGPRPVTPFKTYIEANQFTADHYYSAYPHATATMISSALIVKRAVCEFNELDRNGTPEQFTAAYRGLLTSMQDTLLAYDDTGGSLLVQVGRMLRESPGLLRRVCKPSQCGTACAITMLIPVRAGAVEALRGTLADLDRLDSPLSRLPAVHFGRWVVIDQLKMNWPGAPSRGPALKSQYLLFTACATAPDARTFLTELTTGIPETVDSVWQHCVGYPATAAAVADAPTVAKYLSRGLIKASMFYAGYADVTPNQVEQALHGRERFEAFVLEHQGDEPATLHAAYRQESPAWFS